MLLDSVTYLNIVLKQPRIALSNNLNKLSTNEEADKDRKNKRYTEPEEYPEITVSVLLLKTTQARRRLINKLGLWSRLRSSRFHQLVETLQQASVSFSVKLLF